MILCLYCANEGLSQIIPYQNIRILEYSNGTDTPVPLRTCHHSAEVSKWKARKGNFTKLEVPGSSCLATYLHRLEPELVTIMLPKTYAATSLHEYPIFILSIHKKCYAILSRTQERYHKAQEPPLHPTHCLNPAQAPTPISCDSA